DASFPAITTAYTRGVPVAGSILLKPLPGRDGVTLTEDIEVGWHLHPDAQGNGCATEAARAVLEREFATGTPRVYAVVMAGNDASMAVARRLRERVMFAEVVASRRR
ncbi:GNAT family N-acetyltransferase, partial [Micromonospora sp. AMSO1212t]|uniref:GNAT family N-acetyltransferase n=1 Tax=Micromonospora sp. AMSO1212t TaxID=2650565 RepID=UPI00124B1D30